MQLQSTKISYTCKNYITNILSKFWLPSRKTKLEEHCHQLNWAQTKADPGLAEPTELRLEQAQPGLPAGQESV